MYRSLAPTALLASFLFPGCADAEECREIKREAALLRAEFEACDGDDRCVVVDLGSMVENACLGEFQCVAAFAEDRDVQEFSRRARELEQDFSSCRECAKAECSRPDRWTAYCDAAERKCQLRARE